MTYGGGFKYLTLGFHDPIWQAYFSDGWLNHQLVSYCLYRKKDQTTFCQMGVIFCRRFILFKNIRISKLVAESTRLFCIKMFLPHLFFWLEFASTWQNIQLPNNQTTALVPSMLLTNISMSFQLQQTPNSFLLTFLDEINLVATFHVFFFFLRRYDSTPDSTPHVGLWIYTPPKTYS